MWKILFAALLAIPGVADAQIFTGTASGIDGDTLRLGDTHFRLFGIDAPEASQTCKKNGEEWRCGQEASSYLAKLVSGKQVACEQRDIDSYGRIVASCEADRLDFARLMIGAGYAIALPDFSDAYVEGEAKARAHKIGIWASDFEPPAAYRAAHPQPAPRRTPVETRSPVSRVTARSASTVNGYFRSCAEAWAAGAAPMYAGSPGYRPGLDGDNDGIACEPFRAR